jgi:hypothetical protein
MIKRSLVNGGVIFISGKYSKKINSTLSDYTQARHTRREDGT